MVSWNDYFEKNIDEKMCELVDIITTQKIDMAVIID